MPAAISDGIRLGDSDTAWTSCYDSNNDMRFVLHFVQEVSRHARLAFAWRKSQQEEPLSVHSIPNPLRWDLAHSAFARALAHSVNVEVLVYNLRELTCALETETAMRSLCEPSRVPPSCAQAPGRKFVAAQSRAPTRGLLLSREPLSRRSSRSSSDVDVDRESTSPAPTLGPLDTVTTERCVGK